MPYTFFQFQFQCIWKENTLSCCIPILQVSHMVMWVYREVFTLASVVVFIWGHVCFHCIRPTQCQWMRLFLFGKLCFRSMSGQMCDPANRETLQSRDASLWCEPKQDIYHLLWHYLIKKCIYIRYGNLITKSTKLHQSRRATGSSYPSVCLKLLIFDSAKWLQT